MTSERSTPLRMLPVAMLCASLLPAQALASEDITLKLAHPLPATHFMWEHGLKHFTEEVTEKTGGKVRFEVYPANQLGRDYYSIITSNLADIALTITMYAPDRFPLTSINELPGFYSSACEGSARYWELAKPGATLDEFEYKPMGLHILFVSTSPPYSMLTTTKKVENLETAKGLKILANGIGLVAATRALGAIPISIPVPELYDALSRGTVDGAVYPVNSTMQYKLEEKMNYSLDGLNFGSGSFYVGMSAKKWEALPEDVREIMTAAAATTQRDLCQWLDNFDRESRELLVRDHGVVSTTLPPADQAAWLDRIEGVAADWAAQMDATGRKGTEVLEAWKAAGTGR
ncbi:TRAP transporter substrate-binding protein DctP [Ruixingdingia sedimenti]|uniref:TRAP transporter substrate-binding protein DctP n=1 Tax=Ruixingdingia sedimenti TaxID=3073604 RepID=A0ABU1FD75_9RHOB|nr:TRAP transporter substrate-binding protein DctP [Xinfangfangia sp. LG-4]MDR5654820.1 TRAP transporter substrate-binding protein DctP [Xinfangfangia sp. LG-4]